MYSLFIEKGLFFNVLLQIANLLKTISEVFLLHPDKDKTTFFVLFCDALVWKPLSARKEIKQMKC